MRVPWVHRKLEESGSARHRVQVRDQGARRTTTMPTSAAPPPDPFATLVQAALDELPDEFLEPLADVPVMVADHGASVGAYGMYHGAGMANHPNVPAQIQIFRDTLLRDFGHDPILLALQVRRVVRHEIGHHFGFDEDGVRRLGL
ncbi:MAG: metallopeptidase family protein [Patulibacter minatonensis]